MAKIMLVEDDTNLLEIYGARLLAEGYEVVSAKDGEEALAMAVKEKPDLIISDIMMPKISGFDMLDILRSTPETKNTKVIMMTALNQAEDKERADKLGADRYLVKSQVTLEDVAQAAKEALGDIAPAPAEPAMPPAPTPVTEAPAPAEPAMPPAPTPVTEAAQSSPAEMLPPVTADTNNVTSVHTKIINPINDLNKQSEDLKKLIAEEESKDSTPEVSVIDVASPAPAPAPAAPIKIPVIVPPVTPPTPQA
jgi:CheY-like chemotaxis protein